VPEPSTDIARTKEAGRELTFAPAEISDVDIVVALVQAAYRGETSRQGWTYEADLLEGQRTDAEAVQAIIESPDAMVLLAHRPGSQPGSQLGSQPALRPGSKEQELVGCCELAKHTGGVAYFGMFAVWPHLQGEGIGGHLLNEAEEVARRRWGAERMRMTVISRREALIDYYRRRGYVPTGRHEPFPYGDERFGRPLTDDLEFAVLEKVLD